MKKTNLLIISSIFFFISFSKVTLAQSDLGIGLFVPNGITLGNRSYNSEDFYNHIYENYKIGYNSPFMEYGMDSKVSSGYMNFDNATEMKNNVRLYYHNSLGKSKRFAYSIDLGAFAASRTTNFSIDQYYFNNYQTFAIDSIKKLQMSLTESFSVVSTNVNFKIQTNPIIKQKLRFYAGLGLGLHINYKPKLSRDVVFFRYIYKDSNNNNSDSYTLITSNNTKTGPTNISTVLCGFLGADVIIYKNIKLFIEANNNAAISNSSSVYIPYSNQIISGIKFGL